MRKYAIIRVPGSGPPALINMDSIFSDIAEAHAKLAQIEETQLKAHHTFLDIVSFEGKAEDELPKLGIIL